jgi:hypothetical protein
MQGGAILFSEMTPEASWEEEFNDWYDQEHIPLRMAVSGFRSAQRYRILGKRNYLVVYEMDSPAVLKSSDYLSVKNNPSDRTRRMLSSVSGFTRYIAEQTGNYTTAAHPADGLEAPCLYSVFFEVPRNHHGEFNDWYDHVHIPLLLERKNSLLVRRFTVLDGEPESWTHLTLHYLMDAPALESLQCPWRLEDSVHHKHGFRQ